MIRINATEVISLLVEMLLPPASGDNKILSVPLQITARNSFKEIAILVMFVFHRPGRYVKALFNIGEDLHLMPTNLNSWQLLVNHDSAWRQAVQEALMKIEHQLEQEFDNEYEVTASFSYRTPQTREIRELTCDTSKRPTIATIKW